MMECGVGAFGSPQFTLKIIIILATYAMLTCSCNFSSGRDSFTVTRGRSFSERENGKVEFGFNLPGPFAFYQ